MQQPNQQQSVKFLYLHEFWQRSWAIFLITLLFVLIAVGIAFLVPQKYQSHKLIDNVQNIDALQVLYFDKQLHHIAEQAEIVGFDTPLFSQKTMMYQFIDGYLSFSMVDLFFENTSVVDFLKMPKEKVPQEKKVFLEGLDIAYNQNQQATDSTKDFTLLFTYTDDQFILPLFQSYIEFVHQQIINSTKEQLEAAKVSLQQLIDKKHALLLDQAVSDKAYKLEQIREALEIAKKLNLLTPSPNTVINTNNMFLYGSDYLREIFNATQNNKKLDLIRPDIQQLERAKIALTHLQTPDDFILIDQKEHFFGVKKIEPTKLTIISIGLIIGLIIAFLAAFIHIRHMNE